ncbi:hypothetical protein SRHO_G00003820 [Serrasalmus rhombeus]
MENGWEAGIDCLPVEFCKVFWSVLGQDVLGVLQNSIRERRLLLSCRRAVLTLLPKKGDLTELKSWRLVSLLCTDCKLLSKALASRLGKVMEQVVHPDQTYCVPGRQQYCGSLCVMALGTLHRCCEILAASRPKSEETVPRSR